MTWLGALRGAPKAWDLTALLQAAAFAADPKAPLAERHLWLIRLLEWLRHAPLGSDGAAANPLLRLRHLLNVLDRNPAHRDDVSRLLRRFWAGVDSGALLADFGFSARRGFGGELAHRLHRRLLPLTPATTDLGDLFGLLFPPSDDGAWLEALDDATLGRVADLLRRADADGGGDSDRNNDWRVPFLDAIMYLTSAIRAAGFSGPLRQRMSDELLVGSGGEAPFRQLALVAERLNEHALAGDAAALLQEAHYLRALLDACRRCADSVLDHLEEHGVSIDLVFELDQLRLRTHRVEELLNCMLGSEPGPEIARLLADLVRMAGERRSITALFASHYSLLARKVAERSAETGEHYITRDAGEYRAMLRAALGGGAVIAATTFAKFALLALGLSAFWAGLWAGVNYAVSFVLVQLMHFTVATKQPAMTAPAMADKLTDVSTDEAVEGFVDEVAHLIRSQAAGIIGNLAAVTPIVLGVQLAWQAAFGAPLVNAKDGAHVLESITLLGPTAFFAAFTGVLLFASSLIAGWVENWFVWHRLDSAIEWNPRFVARLGAARARRWAAYWRANISGFASNISLGLMLGLVPAVAAFFALPIEVRHVTLSTGQLAAAVGALGFPTLLQPQFWWCVAGIAATGVLNLAVSFLLAFKVALRSRGIRLADRSRIYRAIRRRMLRQPRSFIAPPAG
jgi:site-specific recombinase